MQGQGQLIKKLHLRPASLSSKFHRQLTEEAARRHVKVNKVKATATVMDPNKLKAEREKAEEERIRSRETLQRRQVCIFFSQIAFQSRLVVSVGTVHQSLIFSTSWQRTAEKMVWEM